MKKRWTDPEKRKVWENAGIKSIPEIASMLGRTQKAIYELLRRNNWLLRRRYTENELYLLKNFPSKSIYPIIADKSKNAIRIRKSRLKV